MKVSVNANFGDGRTIKAFQDTLEARMKYMRETARDSIAAMAIDTLKSIRAATRIAKPGSVKVLVKKDETLEVSFTTRGKQKIPCLRLKGSRVRYTGEEIVLKPARIGKTAMAFRFTDIKGDKKRDYIIIANSQGEARTTAKRIVFRRYALYAGLAKRALGALMMKTSTLNVRDVVSPKANAVALANTEKKETIATNTDAGGGKYALILEDSLRYALKALKGGLQAVNIALLKAINKVTSIINKKIKDVDFLGNKIKLPTPFPEVRKRK